MTSVFDRGMALFSGIRTHLLVGVAGLLAGGVAGSVATSTLKDGEIARIERNHAQAEARAVSAALTRIRDQGRITAAAGQASAAKQARIEIRYRTLRQKVPVYVTHKADADAVVPLGAIVMLDAAARGSDPDGVSFAAGKSHDTASGIKLSTLVGVVVDNYGVANANAQRLNDLQDWVRRQQALAR